MHLLLLIPLLILGPYPGSSEHVESSPLDVGLFPFVVGFRHQGPQGVFVLSHCLGTIVGPRWVVTAGGCLFTNRDTVVYAGLTEFSAPQAIQPRASLGLQAQYRDVVHQYQHPEEDAVGLIKVGTPFDFQQGTVGAAEIYHPPERLDQYLDLCAIVGWGTWHPTFIPDAQEGEPLFNANHLVYRQVRAGLCPGYEEALSEVDGRYRMCAFVSMIACTSDWGSPLVCEGKLAGLATDGHGNLDCVGHHTAFVGLEKYQGWMNRTMFEEAPSGNKYARTVVVDTTSRIRSAAAPSGGISMLMLGGGALLVAATKLLCLF